VTVRRATRYFILDLDFESVSFTRVLLLYIMKLSKRGLCVTIVILVLIFIEVVLLSIKNYPLKKIFLSDTEIMVTIADTPLLQSQGLSGRAKLDPQEGMLFIFNQPQLYKFWMKDMRFPIDIIWFDIDKKIISVNEYVEPGSYPRLFTPVTPAAFVLEVPRGFFMKHNLKIGDTIKF